MSLAPLLPAEVFEPDAPAGAMFELSAVAVGPRTSWLRVAGELDLATVGRLAAVLEQQYQAGRCFARLDLSEVSFLDCAGLGVLVHAHHRFLAHGTLILTGVSPRIQRLLELTGLDQVLFTIARATDPQPAPNAPIQTAVATRAVIDQGVGVVMGRAGCTVVEATERLRVLSHSTHHTMQESAQSMLDRTDDVEHAMAAPARDRLDAARSWDQAADPVASRS